MYFYLLLVLYIAGFFSERVNSILPVPFSFNPVCVTASITRFLVFKMPTSTINSRLWDYIFCTGFG